ncbi:hypothetical protein CPC08DRAFT_752810 [Agrocybe pediades]|nr:hypothetical protein CPC08DRAFT_752810 [Agrocybe pediades]
MSDIESSDVMNEAFLQGLREIEIYVPLTSRPILATSDQFSLVFSRWEMCAIMLFGVLAQGILQTRVYALYGRSKKVLTVMLTLYMINNAIVCWSVVTNTIQGHSMAIGIEAGNVCTFPPFPANRAFSLFLPPIAFESGLCIMVLYKAYQTFRTSPGKNKTLKLMEVLMRDSALYLLMLSMIYTACFTVWLTQPYTVGALASPDLRLRSFDELHPGEQDDLQPSRDRCEGADFCGKKCNTIRYDDDGDDKVNDWRTFNTMSRPILYIYQILRCENQEEGQRPDSGTWKAMVLGAFRDDQSSTSECLTVVTTFVYFTRLACKMSRSGQRFLTTIDPMLAVELLKGLESVSSLRFLTLDGVSWPLTLR